MRRLLFVLAAAAFCAAPARALNPNQLTAQERAVYDGLKSDRQAAQQYLDTRDFVKQCQRVVAHSMKALDLPVQPDDFNAQYVSAAEQRTVDKAVDMNVAALINS